MNRDAKRIKPRSQKSEISDIKTRIRESKNPFDSDTTAFKKAIAELRKEGLNIIHDKKMCRYYNPLTIDKRWGY